MVSVLVPAVIASMVTLFMYIGEMSLLGGQLYRFGGGFFFRGMGRIVLAPVDVLIIVTAGLISAGIGYLLNQAKD